jgi:hypothetical protein
VKVVLAGVHSEKVAELNRLRRERIESRGQQPGAATDEQSAQEVEQQDRQRVEHGDGEPPGHGDGVATAVGALHQRHRRVGQADGIGRRRDQVQRVAGQHAQVEREMAVGEAAPLLAVQIPERVEGAAVRIPEFLDGRGHAQRGGVETGCAALIRVAADPLIKVDIPDAQRQAGCQNGCQQ